MSTATAPTFAALTAPCDRYLTVSPYVVYFSLYTTILPGIYIFFLNQDNNLITNIKITKKEMKLTSSARRSSSSKLSTTIAFVVIPSLGVPTLYPNPSILMFFIRGSKRVADSFPLEKK